MSGSNPFSNERGNKNRTTWWWGAIWCLSGTNVSDVVHRVGGGVVQGVFGGPAAGGVAAFPGLQAFGEGAVASGLNFGGEAGEAEEGAGTGDGAGPKLGGGGEPRRASGDAEEGSAGASGVEVRSGGVGGGDGEHGVQGDAASGGGEELGAEEQVVAVVDAFDVGEPSLC